MIVGDRQPVQQLQEVFHLDLGESDAIGAIEVQL